jgi:hypothetical protein
MRSIDRANKLLSNASNIFVEMMNAKDNGNWNLAVRRAQEVVELTLKSVLAQLGVDYPKIHDVAPVVRKVFKDRDIHEYDEFIIWLVEFSYELAVKRAPAFYHEEEYEEDDARTSVEGAKRVFEFGKKFVEEMRK